MSQSQLPPYWTPIEQAAYRTVHDFRKNGLRGAHGLAPLLNKAAGTLSNEVNPEVETHKLGLCDAIALQHAARDVQILHAMAQMLGYVCIESSPFEGTSDVALLELVLSMNASIGNTSEVILEALADGDISASEFRQIQSEIYLDGQAQQELLRRLRGLRRDEDETAA